MKQLAFLEQELILLQENIARIKKFKAENEKYIPYSSRVFGELRHRMLEIFA